jgi:2-polyprenyl-3-methyl-5-hydroxy-6-metoxy-1,4-benzoquinol methylase
LSKFISDDYRQLLAQMHQAAPWGTKGFSYIQDFLPFCEELRCKTVLDYGSGFGTVRRHLAESNPSLSVAEYDPAIESCAGDPLPADFIVCTDVMEHVEIEYVDDVLEHIHNLMLIGGYFSIGLTKAKRVLPDGQNAHITIKPSGWWLEKLNHHSWSVVECNPGRKSLRLHVKKN